MAMHLDNGQLAIHHPTLCANFARPSYDPPLAGVVSPRATTSQAAGPTYTAAIDIGAGPSPWHSDSVVELRKR